MNTEKKSIEAPRKAVILGKFLSQNRLAILLVLIGFVGGMLWLAAIRFLIIKTPETHYHANFAVYINGVREEFKETTYYEEVAACTAAYDNNPKGRVHMHDQINDVIHVHDKRVTYGTFFQNIGWTLGDNVLETLTNIYQENGETKLTFMLNGQEIENLASRIIGNTDKLLVSYGRSSAAELNKQFATVSDSAQEVNKYQDPASCSGLNGAGHDSILNRFKRATFWN